MRSAANKHTDPAERRVQSSAEVLRGDAVQPKAMADAVPVPNRTGLPDGLKAGIEQLSGHSMNDVKVHYNSSAPAGLQAHAYAQGTDIHLGPGQERHLPHEAWHVVQQKQGRVRPTRQLKDKVSLNDNQGLENEADRMGTKALQMKATLGHTPDNSGAAPYPGVVQRRVGLEYETNILVSTEDGDPLPYHQLLYRAKTGLWKIEADSSCAEFVTEPFDTTHEGGKGLMEAVNEMVHWASSVEKVTAPVHGTKDKAFLEAVAPESGTAKNPKGKKVVFPDTSITSAGIKASPQATGGVTLDKIPLLFEMALKTELPHLSAPGSGYEDRKIKEPDTKKPSLDNIRNENKEQEDDEGEFDESPELLAELAEMDNMNLPEIHDDDAPVDKEKAISELFESEMEEYQGMNRFHEVSKELASHGINPDKAPYTLSGMSWVEQIPMARATHLAGIAIKKLSPKASDLGKLQGLLTLVFSYILTGSRQEMAYKYSKQIAPIMSRTNIKRLYGELDEEEKAIFTPEFVLEALNMADEELMPMGFGNKEPATQGPTRADWIHSIAHGTPNAQIPLKDKSTIDLPFGHSQLGELKENGYVINPHNYDADLLSFGSHSAVVKDRHIEPESEEAPYVTTGGSSSMGEQETLDVDSEDGSRLAVMELRRLPPNQYIKDWLPTAQVIFDVFMKIKHSK